MSKINKIKINDVLYNIEDLSVGNIDDLSTNDKSSLVNAINEVFNNASSGGNPSGGGNSTINYSTEEQTIGTYINGEIIYRKVVVGNLNGTWKENGKTFSWIDLGVKVDKVIRLDVCFQKDELYKYTSATNPDLVVSVRTKQDTQLTDIQIGLTSSMSNGQEIDIIIEYTKANE